MRKITKHNYEAFYLDYLEGNLSKDLEKELFSFLEDNLQLKAELLDFDELPILEAPVAKIPQKEAFKKGSIIDKDNYETYFIKEVEGRNSEELSKALKIFLKENKQYQKDWELYQNTILEAPFVLFKNKQDLKKKRKVLTIWYYAAAILFVMFFMNIVFNISNGIHQKRAYVARTIHKTPAKDSSICLADNTYRKEESKKELEHKKESLNSKLNKKKIRKQVVVKFLKPLKPKLIPQMLSDDKLHEINSRELVDIAYLIKNEEGNEAKNKNQIASNNYFTVKQFLLRKIPKKFLQIKRNQNDEAVAYAVTLGKFSLSGKIRN